MIVDIIITQWALNSYLNLAAKRVFTQNEYQHAIRPDALLLRTYPNNTKFNQPKFWSIAKDGAGLPIANGFKMKWHQVGNGKIQLRLPVGIWNEAFLCEAYVKENHNKEKRQLAKFKTHLKLIEQNNYIKRGVLS